QRSSRKPTLNQIEKGRRRAVPFFFSAPPRLRVNRSLSNLARNLPLHFEISRQRRQGVVENDGGFGDWKEDDVVASLRFHHELVEADVVDRDQRAGLPFQLERTAVDQDLRWDFHGRVG